jgi:hypothetical protein
MKTNAAVSHRKYLFTGLGVATKSITLMSPPFKVSYLQISKEPTRYYTIFSLSLEYPGN